MSYLGRLLYWHILKINLQLHQSYLCGYPLDIVFVRDFFRRYGKFNGRGLCYMAAATAMLALKNNRTARLVECSYTDDEHPDKRHRWVEFRFGGVWWVLDPAWTTTGLKLRRIYQDDLKERLKSIRIIRICDHQQFWSYTVSQQLHEKMQQPETSWLTNELFETYSRHTSETRDEMFHPDITKLTVSETAGSQNSANWALSGVSLMMTPRIMRELMERPTRMRPTLHTLRRAKSVRRKLRYAYIQLLATTGEIELAQTASKQYGMDYEAALRYQIPNEYKLRCTTKPSSSG